MAGRKWAGSITVLDKKDHTRSGIRVFRGTVTSPAGFRAAAVRCGIKTSGKDLAVVASDAPAAFAGMFTTNRLAAAPVLWSRRIARRGEARALVVNSGCANACTGKRGRDDAAETARIAAGALGVDPAGVAVASTGLIGMPLPMGRIRKGVARACERLSPANGLEAARAIMTTDTRPKQAAAEFTLDGKLCRIGGMAKGSGMIQPGLATMIAVLTTDAAVEKKMLARSLRACADRTFNALTVDGERSTNDSVFLFANGRCGNALIRSTGESCRHFVRALEAVCLSLTRELARDGEGATRLITVSVEQALSRGEAMSAARAVANSLLVKTAVFGRDPNWGRIASAVGASPARFRPERMSIRIGDVRVFERGTGVPFDKEILKQILSQDEVRIDVNLGAGRARAAVYTCDLTYDYIRINAEYHT